MKTIYLLAFTLFITNFTCTAQEISNQTIGLRLGDSDGFGAEISYQKALFRYNRAELNIGWRDHKRYDALKFSAIFQSIYNIDSPLNWYYGFGGGAGNASFEKKVNEFGEDVTPTGGLFLFAAGDLGIEYNFDFNFPLLVSLDIRPELGMIGYGGFSDRFDFDIALGFRYQF